MARLSMQRGEMSLASFPFGDVPGMKLRPVLLLTPPMNTLHAGVGTTHESHRKVAPGIPAL